MAENALKANMLQSPAEVQNRSRERRILDAARELFEQSGYSATSLDDIVSKANCSKSAIYQLFGSKEDLLTVLVRETVEAMRNELFIAMIAGEPVRATLENFATLLLTRVLSNSHVSIIQAVILEARAKPTLAKRYWREGPETNMANLSRYLAVQAAEGHLKIDDPDEAASCLIGMTLWPPMLGQLVETRTPLDDEHVRHTVTRVVDSFLKLYSEP